MNARLGFPSPAVALIAMGCSISTAAGSLLANGGFESGFDGWTWGGNVSVETEPPYAPTEGSKLVAFSAHNLPADGWICQEVEIPNGIGRFHTLRFDAGNLGFLSTEVRLRIEVTEIGYGASVPRVNEVITVPGITGGATRWQQAAYDFPTPVTGRVLVKLTDLSPETNATDLVVDQANFSPGTNAITFAPALDNGLITLNGSQLATNSPLAIDARPRCHPVSPFPEPASPA